MLYAAPPLSDIDERVLEEIASMRRDLQHVVQQSPLKWTATSGGR